MVTFLTFFLGLTTGPHPVEVAAGENVAAIEFFLDGVQLLQLDNSPWTFECDFGEELLPHELEAIAFDDRGRELARAQQRINLPRPEAEATLSLSDFAGGRYRAAQLAWRTVDEATPTAIVVTFDTTDLEVVGGNRVVLPHYDAKRIHILSAVLNFQRNVEARSEIAFGGQYGEAVSTELTAVALDLREGARLPTIDQIQDWFLVDGEKARAVAVEEGYSEVWVVRDRSALPHLRSIGQDAWQRASYDRRPQGRGASAYLRSGLGKNDVLRYVHTSPRPVTTSRGTVTQVFPLTENLNATKQGGIAYALANPNPAESALQDPQWIASAVALAGLKASASNRPRVVLLVLGDSTVDSSNFDPENVRHFLEVLGVPFRTWKVGARGTTTADWGPGRAIGGLKEINAAVKEVESMLERQFIVWLDGIHLPQEVALTAAAATTVVLASD